MGATRCGMPESAPRNELVLIDPASGAASSDPSSSCGSTKDNLPDTARSRPLVALLRRPIDLDPHFPFESGILVPGNVNSCRFTA